MARGVADGNAVQSGSLLMTATSTSVTSSPWKARRPVSISFSTHPNAQMSARLSMAFPRACSGDMYAAVPRMRPSWVIAGVVMVGDCETPGDEATSGSIAFASPKSSTLTVPSDAYLDVRGLQVAVNDSLACAAPSASAICLRRAGPGRAEWPLARCDRNGRPFDQFHHESGLSVGPLETVDCGDVGVIQGREDLGFTLKAGESIDSCATASGRP